MARGVDGRDVFIDRVDRLGFLDRLRLLRRECDFKVFAYCLMNNHFHLALKIGLIPLSQIIHRLLTGYVGAFNLRHERTGHLFQARYKAVVCLDERQLYRLVEYIHANPVRAEFVATGLDWTWSSIHTYARNVDDGITDVPMLDRTLTATDDDEFDPWKESSTAVLSRHSSADQRARLDDLAAAVIGETGDATSLQSRSRRPDVVRLKRRFVEIALNAGYCSAEIGRWLGCTGPGVRYLAGRRKKLSFLSA